MSQTQGGGETQLHSPLPPPYLFSLAEGATIEHQTVKTNPPTSSDTPR
jgi:hypothetical protein